MGDKPDTSKPRRRWKPLFLKALAERGTVIAAARIAGISRQTAYEARKDAKFAEAWDALQEDAVEVLEKTAFELAVDGSERMLIFLLKAHKPDYYRENVHIEGGVTHTLEVELDAESRELEEQLGLRAKAPPGVDPAPRALAAGSEPRPDAAA